MHLNSRTTLSISYVVAHTENITVRQDIRFQILFYWVSPKIHITRSTKRLKDKEQAIRLHVPS